MKKASRHFSGQEEAGWADWEEQVGERGGLGPGRGQPLLLNPGPFPSQAAHYRSPRSDLYPLKPGTLLPTAVSLGFRGQMFPSPQRHLQQYPGRLRIWQLPFLQYWSPGHRWVELHCCNTSLLIRNKHIELSLSLTAQSYPGLA